MESWQGADAAEAARANRWKVAKCGEHRCTSKEKNPQALCEAQNRQAKEVERDVTAKDWIYGGSVGGVRDSVLPKRDLLPVCGDLCANEQGDNDRADAQCAVANRRTSTTSGTISVCTKKATERINDSVGLQISAVIHERGSRFTR